MPPTRSVNPGGSNTLMGALETESVPDYSEESDDLASTTDSDSYGDMEIFLAELEAVEEGDPDVQMYAGQVRRYIGFAQGTPNPAEGGWIANVEGGAFPDAAAEENGGNNPGTAVNTAGQSGWRIGDDSIKTTIDLQNHQEQHAIDGTARIWVNEVDQRKLESGGWVAGGESNANHNTSGETLVAVSHAAFSLARHNTAYGDGILPLQLPRDNNLICEGVSDENGENTNEEGGGGAAAANIITGVSAAQPHSDDADVDNDESAQLGQLDEENQVEQMEAQISERQAILLGTWIRISCMQDLGNMDQE